MTSGQDEFLFTVIVFFTFLCVCAGISSIVDSTRCFQTGKTLNYKTEWHYWTGCVVEKPDGDRVLLRQMRDMGR